MIRFLGMHNRRNGVTFVDEDDTDLSRRLAMKAAEPLVVADGEAIERLRLFLGEPGDGHSDKWLVGSTGVSKGPDDTRLTYGDLRTLLAMSSRADDVVDRISEALWLNFDFTGGFDRDKIRNVVLASLRAQAQSGGRDDE